MVVARLFYVHVVIHVVPCVLGARCEHPLAEYSVAALHNLPSNVSQLVTFKRTKQC